MEIQSDTEENCCNSQRRIFKIRDLKCSIENSYVHKCNDCKGFYFYESLEKRTCPICENLNGKYIDTCFIHVDDNIDLPKKCNCGEQYGIVQPHKFSISFKVLSTVLYFP